MAAAWLISCSVAHLPMSQFACARIMLLFKIESCSMARAGGMDKSKSEGRATVVTQD